MTDWAAASFSRVLTGIHGPGGIRDDFPISASATNRRGINHTDWCPIDKATYDACIDPRDYRPKP